MLNIIADAKKYMLSDSRIIIVKRINVRQFYLIVASLLVYKSALGKITGIDNIKTVQEYINYIKDKSLDIAKAKVEFENIKNYVQECIDIKIDKDNPEIILEILGKIMDFNSISLGSSGKEFNSLDELNEELEKKLGIVSNLMKTSFDKILNMENYTISVMVREYLRNRIITIDDIRLAYHGDRQSYIKYTKGLMGEKVYSGEEIMNNPDILKAVH